MLLDVAALFLKMWKLANFPLIYSYILYDAFTRHLETTLVNLRFTMPLNVAQLFRFMADIWHRGGTFPFGTYYIIIISLEVKCGHIVRRILIVDENNNWFMFVCIPEIIIKLQPHFLTSKQQSDRTRNMNKCQRILKIERFNYNLTREATESIKLREQTKEANKLKNLSVCRKYIGTKNT